MVDFSKYAAQINTSSDSSFVRPPESYGFVNKHGAYIQFVVTPEMEGDNAVPPFQTVYNRNMTAYGSKKPLPHDKQLRPMTAVQVVGMPTAAALKAAQAPRERDSEDDAGDRRLERLQDLWVAGLRVVALQMSNSTAKSLFEQLTMGYEPARVDSDGNVTYGAWFLIKLSSGGQSYDVRPMPPAWDPASAGIRTGTTVQPLVSDVESATATTLAELAGGYAAAVKAAWEADAPSANNADTPF